MPSRTRRNRSRCRAQKHDYDDDDLEDNEDLETYFRTELIKYLEAIRQALKIALRMEDDEASSEYYKGTYAIVTTNKNLYSNYNKICAFMGILEEEGFELTLLPSTIQDDLIFILIHANQEVLRHFAEVHSVDMMCEWDYERMPDIKTGSLCIRFFRFLMATELTQPDSNTDVYKRARKTVSGEKPTEATTGEKAVIINKVLSTTRTGVDAFDVGINEFIKTGIFETAFPLHDGDFEWTDDGYLNDRQLLAKYWSSAKCWYKQQPLDLIQKYYGTEVAFYFAWLGFYNKMLVPASIIGILCFLYGVITLNTTLNRPSKELCESNIILCPKCIGHCRFIYLNKSCGFSTLTYLFDNEATVVFAALMSFWATAFMQLWKRKQAILQIRWNVEAIKTDTTERMEYLKKVRRIRKSPITGKVELYEPKIVTSFRYALSTTTILLMMIFVISVFVLIMVYQTAAIYWLKGKQYGNFAKDNVELLASLFASIITVIFIIFFEKVYERVILCLTNLENPRTQLEYDDSVTYKSYVFSFVNNYSTTFYIAFVKGRLYTHPGHMSDSILGTFRSVTCEPSGCIFNLSIQLLIVALIKYILGNIIEIIIPILKIACKKLKTKKNIDEANLSIWEKDYLLNSINYFYLIHEYTEMIVQYGYVIFFVAAFPLGPFFALLNNLAEIRIDAKKYLQHSRRPIPKRVGGIGAWNGILQAATYLGVITNAFVIAFTSNFVPRQYYRYTKNAKLIGYLNTTLSKFNITDGNLPLEQFESCFYSGKRYPPDHPNKYELSDEYWSVLLVRLAVVLVFEHMVMIIMGILAYCIPDIPRSVRQYLTYKYNAIKEQKVQNLREVYIENRKNIKTEKMSFKEQTMVLNNDYI